MASSNKVFVSPGVYTSERDLTFVAQSVGVTTLGIVGETLQGPAFEPIFIRNFDEFQAYFGGTSPEKFVNTQIPKYEAAYIAKSYLSQSNQLFVTRVLGLSGYDAGPSWSIKTIGNIDPATLGATGNTGPVYLNFTGTTGNSSNVTIVGSIPTELSSVFYSNYTTNTNGLSTIDLDFRKSIVDQINLYSTSAATSASTSYFWGSVSGGTLSDITGDSLNTVTTLSNILGVNNVDLTSADLTSYENDAWYYSLFNYASGDYSGFGFGASLSSISAVTATSYSGSMAVYLTNYSGTAYSDYDNLVVATLRSRGISQYTSSQKGPNYEVTGKTDVTLITNGSYSAVSENPLSTFVVSGISSDGDTFNFETSLQSTDVNSLSNVFGRSNFGKDREEVPLFVEEVYYTLLLNGYRNGKIRGINSSLISTLGARSLETDSIGFYLEQYQTPESPYVVSELRGNKTYKLFKFRLISDGNAANRLVKISIGNVSFNNGTFDVFVRDYFDTDRNVVVLESFTNCSLDPTLNNFVANKIGTANGEFALKSKFIMLEMSEEAPADALPCGFEGYISREYENATPPFVNYKTRYLKAGDVIYNPPFGASSGGDNPVISSGENPRFAYLGISNITGYDSDFFQYKGKQLPANLGTDTVGIDWGYITKGFHFDSGATVVTITSGPTSGQSAYEVGVGSFRSEPTENDDPYYRLNTRKFTLLPYGGFDGWDIYREYRTNDDRFILGASGYKYGAEASITYPTASGWGAFKQISGPNQEVWGNTDYYAYLFGQKTLANPEAVNINVFVTPGIDYVNNSNLVEEAVTMIETDRADSIYICTTPDFDLFSPTLDPVDTNTIYPQEAVDNLDQTGIDSSYTATFYPWILTRDTVNNTQIYLPPTGEVCRNLALTDNIAFPWFASAGYTRGLVNSVKARLKLTQEDRDTLYQGRINPIATFNDVGTVIWGNKTLQVRQSALDRINVRRLLLQARKLISAVAVRLLFEQNDNKVRQDFLDSVNPILDSIRRDRGLIDFRVTVSNTPEDLDSNTLTGKIFLKPTRALEFIDIEFIITPTGASFDNI